ncbi:MAG: alkaline phosphatase family protein, partial [Actinobacteria bacterium]|nr:alkaline phosphatase family protein [Actinomycetota bacterium]
MGSPVVPCSNTRNLPWVLRNSGAPNRSARTGVPVTKRKTFACLAASGAAAACAVLALQGTASAAGPGPTSKHVLLISVDGMHQSDLDWYVANHPSSTLAKMIHTGSEYTNAMTSNPSDSDPGGTALMTGGNPKSTGVYYDVEYSHKVDQPGAACTPGQPATGGDVIYDSPDDALAQVPDFIDPANGSFPSFDENGSIFPQGVDTNPAAIMNLKFDPNTSLNSGT